MGCFPSKPEAGQVDFSGLGPGWVLLAESMADKSPRERAAYMSLLTQVASQHSKQDPKSLPASISSEQSAGGSLGVSYIPGGHQLKSRSSGTLRSASSNDTATQHRGSSTNAAATDIDDPCTSDEASVSTTPSHSASALGTSKSGTRKAAKLPDQLPQRDSNNSAMPASCSASAHVDGSTAPPVRQRSKLSNTTLNNSAVWHRNLSAEPMSWEQPAVNTDTPEYYTRKFPRSQPGCMEEVPEHSSAPMGVMAAASKQARHDAMLLCKPMFSAPPPAVDVMTIPAGFTRPSESTIPGLTRPSESTISPLISPRTSLLSPAPSNRHVKWAPLPNAPPALQQAMPGVHQQAAPGTLTASYPEGLNAMQDGMMLYEAHGQLHNGMDEHQLRRCVTEVEGPHPGTMLQPGSYAVAWQPRLVAATPSGRLVQVASLNSLRHSATSGLEDAYYQAGHSPRGTPTGLYMMYGAHVAPHMMHHRGSGSGINDAHPALAQRTGGPVRHMTPVGQPMPVGMQVPLSPVQHPGLGMHDPTKYRHDPMLYKQMLGVQEQVPLPAGMRWHAGVPHPSGPQLSVQPLLQARLREQQQQQLDAQKRQRQQHHAAAQRPTQV